MRLALKCCLLFVLVGVSVIRLGRQSSWNLCPLSTDRVRERLQFDSNHQLKRNGDPDIG